MLGAYITIGIFVLVVLLVLAAIIYPRITKRRLVFKWEAPKKKRHVKARRKKRRSVWIKVI